MNSVVPRLSRRLLLPLMFGWSSFAFAADPIALGMNLPRTGQYAQEGLMQMRGALLAVEEINQAGGVLGRPLELVHMVAERPDFLRGLGVALLDVFLQHWRRRLGNMAVPGILAGAAGR